LKLKNADPEKYAQVIAQMQALGFGGGQVNDESDESVSPFAEDEASELSFQNN